MKTTRSFRPKEGAKKTTPRKARHEGQVKVLDRVHSSAGNRFKLFQAVSFKELLIPKFIRSNFLNRHPRKDSGISPSFTVVRPDIPNGFGFGLNNRPNDTKTLVAKQPEVPTVQYQLKNLPSIFDNVTLYLLNHPTYGFYVASLYIETDLSKHGIPQTFFTDEMSRRITRTLKGRILHEDDPVTFTFDGQRIKATIRDLIVQQELLDFDDILKAMLVGLAAEIRRMMGDMITMKTRAMIEDTPRIVERPSIESVSVLSIQAIQPKIPDETPNERLKECPDEQAQEEPEDDVKEHFDEHPGEFPNIPSGEQIVTETTTWDINEEPDLEAQVDSIPELISHPERYGIGGLDKEFRQLFDRALASRLYPQTLLNNIGIEHVKGIILYGPPGTGKTLMARNMAKCLDAKVEIVNGPEIFDKYVGGSEQELRKHFEKAEKDYREHGIQSDLHVIIFDEIDAICKRRGNETGGTGRVGDNIVNQLLTKMDGIEQLHNLLLIGMTNRLDAIDEALLRPGRFEIQLELKMPDAQGRKEILEARVSKMTRNNCLNDDVDLFRLAKQTENFSGADLAGLVRCATYKALGRWWPSISQRHHDSAKQDFRDCSVTMQDFQEALLQVRPVNNPSLEELEQAVSYGIIHFDCPLNAIKNLLRKGELCAKQVSTSGRARPVSLLLYGPPETGKTALAVTIARESNIPYVRLISPDNLTNLGQYQQVTAINKVFEDCYKNPLSVVIIDDVEQLLDWDPVRQTYSMAALRALSALIKRPPPKSHGLLIIATTSTRPVLGKLRMLKLFDTQLHVPPITSWDAIHTALEEVKLFEDNLASSIVDIRGRIALIYEQDPVKLPGIGIKRLLRIIELAKQESGYDDVVKRFTDELLESMENMVDTELIRFGRTPQSSFTTL